MLSILFGSWTPYHLLSYAFLTGVTLWHSFISSLIARRTLARSDLGKLQSRLFPIYFSLQSGLSAFCLLTTSNRSGQMLFLVGVVAGLMNLFIFGPQTTKLMRERLELEREEGKLYNEEGISDRFKALNKQFLNVHGRSVVMNMAIVLSVLIYPFLLPAHLI